MGMRVKLIAGMLVVSLLLIGAAVVSLGASSPNVATASNSVVIESLAGVSDKAAGEIRTAADATCRFYATNDGLVLEKPVTIVLTPDRKSYLAEVVARFGVSELEAQRAARGTDALSGGSLIVVNVSGVPSVRRETFLIAHELTHHYQDQLAGSRDGEVKWLLEGMAEAAGAQVVASQGYWRLEQYQENWRQGLTAMPNKPELTDLTTSDGWSGSISRYGSTPTYKTAGLAVLILTERYGQRQVLDYFVELGKGNDPEAAFKQAFGITMADFSAQYRQLLRKAS